MKIRCWTDTKTDSASLCLLPQSAIFNPAGVSRILQALLGLCLLQYAAAGAASSAHLLGLPHPAHGLQVCVHGQGEKSVHEKLTVTV